MVKSKKVGRPRLPGPKFYCHICSTCVPCNSWRQHIRDVHDYPHFVKPGCQPYDLKPSTPVKIVGGDLTKKERADQEDAAKTQIAGKLVEKLA